MNERQFTEACNADIRRMTGMPAPTVTEVAVEHYVAELQRLHELQRDAEAYRFLRDAPSGPPDAEAAVLWEELLTTGCRGAEWDKTVAALRALYTERGWI